MATVDPTLRTTAGSGPLVELRGLTKSYPEGGQVRTVFADLSAAIQPGESIALLGRSGSGKSTLLNLISGIDLPDSGAVIIAGTCLTSLSERNRTLFRRDRIGFVFQFYNLIPTLTVGENLLLPRELQGRLDAAARAEARELLAEVGLADRWDSYPDRLSGGEQQRVAVARAVVHGPELLLADEPTGNLDAATGRQVLELLDQLARRTGMTTIMVTHSREIARVADRVLAIRDGRLVEEQRSGREGEP